MILKHFINTLLIVPVYLITSILIFILIYVILIYVFNNVIIKKTKLEVFYEKRKF